MKNGPMRLTARFIFILFTIAFNFQLGFTQTDINGATEVVVGAVVPAIEFELKSDIKDKRGIHDFTFNLPEDCGVNISRVTLKKTDAGLKLGDWDVDDDKDLMSNETDSTETDDLVIPASRTVRIDNKGGGNEDDPQDIEGNKIGDNRKFKIFIEFDTTTTAACTLTVTPTSESGVQYGTVVAGDVSCGDNLFCVDNATALLPGIATAEINGTGQSIDEFELITNGEYNLIKFHEIDSQTDSVIAIHDCAGPSCFITLTQPVPTGGILAFDAFFDQLSSGDCSPLTLRLCQMVIPTLSEWGLIILSLLLLSIGIFFIYSRQGSMAVAGNAQIQNQTPIFVKNTYFKVLAVLLAIAAVGLGIATWWFGSLSLTDFGGTLISTGIVAYMIHLWVEMTKK